MALGSLFCCRLSCQTCRCCHTVIGWSSNTTWAWAKNCCEQSSSVSVPRDDSVGTRSFGSKNDVDDDLCPVNDANGRDARRGSGRLEDQQQASPTSVAARSAYDGNCRWPDVADDAQHRQDVDRVAQWLCSGSQPDAPPRAAAWRLSACSGPGLGTSDALRNASVVAACLRHGASLGGAAADEEPREPSRKKPRPLAVETPPRALLAPAARRDCVLHEVTIDGRRYFLGADAIEPVVERVEAGDAGEALHFCKDRGVYVVLDALRNAGDVDTVRRRKGLLDEGVFTVKGTGVATFLAALGVRVSWSAMALVMACVHLVRSATPRACNRNGEPWADRTSKAHLAVVHVLTEESKRVATSSVSSSLF